MSLKTSDHRLSQRKKIMLHSNAHIEFPVLLYIHATFRGIRESEMPAKAFENLILKSADSWLSICCGAENSGFKPFRPLGYFAKHIEVTE